MFDTINTNFKQSLLSRISLIMFLSSMGLFVCAQDLVYTPKNPAFGGNTFNYQWLQSSADAQNDHQEEQDFGFEQPSELDQFTQALNQQVLGQISRQLFTQQFGTSGLQPGIYSLGNLSVEIFPTAGGLSINVLDTNTGETSVIIIPTS